VETPEAVLSLAIEPKTMADRERLGQGLHKLMAEDPALRVQADDQTGQVVIAGVSELHLEIVIDRLKREFSVEARVGRPQVLYKETITRTAEGDGRYIGQTGGRGQYGHVKIRLLPRRPGEGYEFVDHTFGGAIPRAFIEPIDRGIRQAMTNGIVAGYPVVDVRVELHDGSYHAADSSEMAFKIAGSMAFKDAAKRAGTVVLEPIVRVDVGVPKGYTSTGTTMEGDVMGNLMSRRALILSVDDRGSTAMISARVPVSEMFGYATDLRSRSRGRATYSMRFDGYQPRPGDPGDRDDEDRHSGVTAPLKPTLTGNNSANALPEPDDDRLGNSDDPQT
jgi:elongation factor G